MVKTPTTTFLVPSLIPLIPGGALYYTMNYALNEQWPAFADKAVYTLGLAAALALGIIAGDDSQYGLYVKTVNGITADYDKDQTWWGFYIDGVSASAGVDSTDIVNGSTYGFKVEK